MYKRQGILYPLPRQVPRICVKGFLLLPTPTVVALIKYERSLRSRETWETTSNLKSYMIGWAYGLTGKQKAARFQHTPAPFFIEWMMGLPRTWTQTHGPSLVRVRRFGHHGPRRRPGCR